MNNMEKAFKANELAVKIETHKDNIKDLKKRSDIYKKEKANHENNRFSILLKGFNSNICIEADDDLIEFMILAEHCRFEKATKELDDLLNGDVNKLKECLEGINDGKQDSRE